MQAAFISGLASSDDAVAGLALTGLRIFLFAVAWAASRHASRLFLQTHGQSHRLGGCLHFSWIIFGAVYLPKTVFQCLAYDIVLGVLGIVATLTAARDFPHRHVKNLDGQSGTLSREALVTQSEMLEHSFYQALNLWQALYLHVMSFMNLSPRNRYAALLLVTAPWLFRRKFPVHSFSANWNKLASAKAHTPLELRLYQIKKIQYLFYKHVVLHGLNLSVAFPLVDVNGFSSRKSWRIFWLALNTSYVMEFFLQTMVKRYVLTQEKMLWLQRLLMAVSSLAALVGVLDGTVRPLVCLGSLALNLVHRQHDFLNVTMIGLWALNLSNFMAQAQ